MHPEFLGTHKTKRSGNLGPIPLPPRICSTPGGLVLGRLPRAACLTPPRRCRLAKR